MTTQKQEFARLLTAVKPVKYTVDYDVIDLDRFRFEGNESIDIAIVEATSTITCHAVELWVHSVSLTTQDGKTIACAEIRHVDKDESVTFVFPETLAAGTTAILSLRFHGILNDKLKGFYRSQYTQDGESRTMAVTQFEACDARRALVCWDEPAIKAKFQISMLTRPDREAISNTPVVSTCVRASKSNPNIQEKHWQFAETPIMSTYLLAMVVGEFDFVSDYTKEGVLVRVYTPVGHSERGRFALRVATQCLSFFTAKFGIPYPLAKLDMLAIPDFAAGAMENWGVVTYREARLLIDDKASSLSQKTDTARTVCHELAHQWFGNLVTMEWWTELWLNEGFARFMEFEAVHDIFPEWNVWGTFVQDITLGTAMEKDAMLSSHPIEVVVHHPDEVDQIFDVISYAKGASVIRMLANFIGIDKFYIGMHNYLTKFAYGNAKTVDLWYALEAASGAKITAMAHTWTTQTGFPVVTVSKNADGSLSLTQQRFLSNGPEDTTSKWDIPLTFLNSSDCHNAGIWTADQASFKIDGDSWVKLNADHTAFYLVNYPSELWQALKAPVAALTLNKLDRVSLLHSAFVLARAGLLPVTEALDFSQAYANEPEYLVWKELSQSLSVYLRLFSKETWFPKFQEYLQRLYKSVMADLTWEKKGTDVEITSNFRRDVISMLGAAKEPSTIAEATARFRAAVAQPGSLSADLRSIVYSINARNTTTPEDDFAYLQSVYLKSNFIEEKLNVLSALGRFVPENIKIRALDWAVQNVRSQDIQYVFGSVGNSDSNVSWKYVQDNWAALSAKYSGVVLGRIVCASIVGFQNEQDAANVDAFLEDKPKAAYARPLESTMEKIRTRAAMYSRDVATLEAWINAL
ncbi:hypothetical protein AC1031_009422 [Aphanomyces cochlioides]|nr:hypothetical protein AC1031_009422 [Aphanomyces cochlioides]